MKTLIAVIVAVLGFSATVAWAESPAPTEQTAKPAAAATRASAPKPAQKAVPPRAPALAQKGEASPGVMCACVSLDDHA